MTTPPAGSTTCSSTVSGVCSLETGAHRESIFGPMLVPHRAENPGEPFGDDAGERTGRVLHAGRRCRVTAIPRQRARQTVAPRAPPKPPPAAATRTAPATGEPCRA